MKSAPEQQANRTPDELRSQMRETWGRVLARLTHPTNPRRDAQGWTVHQVLQDLILQNLEADRARMHYRFAAARFSAAASAWWPERIPK
jgi:hypothetical protein